MVSRQQVKVHLLAASVLSWCRLGERMRMDAQGHKADALEQRRQLLLAASMVSDHLDPQHCLLAVLMDLAGNPLLARYPPKQLSQPHAAGRNFEAFY